MSWLLYVGLGAVAVSIVGLFAFRLHCHHWPAWTGFGEIRRKKADEKELVQPAKTLWDWLQLFVIPLALAVLAVLFNGWQSNRDQEREDERATRQSELAAGAAREETLRAYLAEMSTLMLDRNLIRSRPGSNVRAVARTLTLTTVRRLDGEGRGLVVRFLDEARLLKAGASNRLKLDDADLRFADLHEAFLLNVDPDFTDLRGANFRRAHIGGSLFDANLRDADFRGVYVDKLLNVTYADLRGADLRRASLSGDDDYLASIREACTRRWDPPLGASSTSFFEAQLNDADLRGADLRGVDFRQADLAGRSSRVHVCGGRASPARNSVGRSFRRRKASRALTSSTRSTTPPHSGPPTSTR